MICVYLFEDCLGYEISLAFAGLKIAHYSLSHLFLAEHAIAVQVQGLKTGLKFHCILTGLHKIDNKSNNAILQ